MVFRVRNLVSRGVFEQVMFSLDWFWNFMAANIWSLSKSEVSWYWHANPQHMKTHSPPTVWYPPPFIFPLQIDAEDVLFISGSSQPAITRLWRTYWLVLPQCCIKLDIAVWTGSYDWRTWYPSFEVFGITWIVLSEHAHTNFQNIRIRKR